MIYAGRRSRWRRSRAAVTRDGRFAQVYWAYASDTVEEKIARVVAGRIQSMKEMVGDDVETLREIERLLLA